MRMERIERDICRHGYQDILLPCCWEVKWFTANNIMRLTKPGRYVIERAHIFPAMPISPDVISTALVATALCGTSKIETPSPENRDLLLIYEHLLAVESMCSLQSMTWPVAQYYIGEKANNLMKEELYLSFRQAIILHDFHDTFLLLHISY